MFTNGFSRLQIVILFCIICCYATSAFADCGSIPFNGPSLPDISLTSRPGTAKLQNDPLKVTVYEPKQRAIILWNGREETLLLSTDQSASENSSILEVIPLPAEPVVKQGHFDTFTRAYHIMARNSTWIIAGKGQKAANYRSAIPAGVITFQKKMGAHDITVAQVKDKDGFIGFIRNYLQEQYKTPEAPIKTEFAEMIQGYIDEGFTWFAFDVITLNKNVQSREPIEYTFKSDCVFYPMRISTLERGNTDIDLLVITPDNPDEYLGLSRKEIKTDRQVFISDNELFEINEDWAYFFDRKKTLTMNYWKVNGDISTFMDDIKVK